MLGAFLFEMFLVLDVSFGGTCKDTYWLTVIKRSWPIKLIKASSKEVLPFVQCLTWQSEINKSEIRACHDAAIIQ